MLIWILFTFHLIVQLLDSMTAMNNEALILAARSGNTETVLILLTHPKNDHTQYQCMADIVKSFAID